MDGLATENVLISRSSAFHAEHDGGAHPDHIFEKVAEHSSFWVLPHFPSTFEIVTIVLYIFSPHPQADAFRLPGKDVNVDAQAVQLPPFAP